MAKNLGVPNGGWRQSYAPHMRGIVLAGGTGSRLWPMTRAVSKQLMPVFDKPMIYYPLSTLIGAGIREILIITTPGDQRAFQELLGDGSQWGVSFTYATQDQPRGIAEALIIGDEFIGDGDVALILGDNIFDTLAVPEISDADIHGANVIFLHQVADNSRYGVLYPPTDDSPSRIVEKPANAPRHYPAVTGLYMYANGDHRHVRDLKPSMRGELEITDLNNFLIQHGRIYGKFLIRTAAWLDTGTVEDLHAASEYVRVIEKRQGLKIGCVEASAWRQGFIDDFQLAKLASPLVSSGYGNYLLNLLED